MMPQSKGNGSKPTAVKKAISRNCVISMLIMNRTYPNVSIKVLPDLGH